jgi:Zn-dependent peptidase ImmA (M78 family)/DNA-binding XRE family transcriptional regulator
MARTTANLTQEQAASKLGMARTTMVAIERGERRLKNDELMKLATLYTVSMNLLLREQAVHVDLVAQFRRAETALEKDSDEVARTLNRLASSYVEIERGGGSALRANYPPERAIKKQGYLQQAEDMALELRNRLGLGLGPIPDVIGLLEGELGLRVFVRPLPSKISEAFAYHPEVGACFLLNANHPEERRAWSLAHGVGHLLTTRSSSDICTGSEGKLSERFADAFAASFVLPAPAVRKRFQETVEAHGRFSARHLIHLAHSFHVSREAMARRLEQLELLKKGTFELLRDSGALTEKTAREVLGPEAVAARAERPSRFSLLAVDAFANEQLTEGQLAELLGVDRLEARRIVDALGGESAPEWTVE